MKDTFTKIKMVAFSSMTVSIGIGALMVGWVTFFATDYLGLSAATVGILFMVSKVFDGFTDIIAGIIIDKTNTRWGKGRPYDLAQIGYWITIVFMFVVPIMNVNLTYAWIFIMYTLNNSVFQTLLSCSNPVYLANVVDRPEQSLIANSIVGVFSMVASTAGGIVIPQLAANYGNSREGWGQIAIMIAIPSLVIGLLRFFIVKERAVNNGKVDKVSLKETVSVIFHNKYIVIVAIMILVSNAGYHMINSVTSYYCRYIIGDVGAASIMSLAMLSTVVSLIITPGAAKKIGIAKFIRILTILSIITGLLRLINPYSLPLMFVTGFLVTPGFLTSWLYLSTFIIDCIDFGEWKSGIRREGSTTCLPSLCSKLGVALGAGLVGVLMGASGYNGNLEIQSDSATRMLIAMFSIIPVIFSVIQYIALRFYDLDAKLPTIREELAARKQN